ncbi:MAG: general secretion pathway protein GspK, partial [Candidatus Omnitrophica bacterium]|nr:general secretion pathway protein GspK [Candidatus Omnitrophota bacterium]
ENQNEFATISHNIIDKNNRLKTIYGVIDEERKININIASRELLLALLEEFAVNAAQDIVNNILIWRGDISDNDKIYEKLGYPCKADNFSNIEELTLVKDITPNDYQKLRESITTYGDGFVNINTVSFKTLTIFAHGIAKSLSIDENFADSVATKIIELRDRNGCFKEKNEIDIILTGEEEENIFNKLMDSIIFKSDNFLIEATGNVVKIRGKISAVYNRKDKRILYWHES